MSKKGYREKRNICYEKHPGCMQENIKNIDSSQITYRFIVDSSEIVELIEDIFDECFWEYLLIEDAVKECFENNETFVLFEIDSMPCALALISDIKDDSKRELYQLDVEDYLFERSNGIGSKVVKLLNEKIYHNEEIYGYSVSQAAKFWSRNANNYDHEVFNSMREEHLENGGEKDELFDCEGLMYFCL